MKTKIKDLLNRAQGRSFLDECAEAQTIVEFKGAKFFAGKANKIEAKLLSPEGYDPENLTVCERFISKGFVCLDVGANIGIYSTLMAKWTGCEGVVHAFEPVDHIRRKLELNLQINQITNVVINPVVLGEREGSVEMNQVKEGQFRAGTSTLTENESVASMGKDKFNRVSVAMKKVDVYIAEAGVSKVDFVKVDIEGYEINFLAGAPDLLAKHRPVILMEHNQRRLKFLKIDEALFRSIFEKADYQCFELFETSGDSYFIPYRFDRKMRGINLVCLPR